MTTDNEARYECDSCSGRITAPGVGHAEECSGMAASVEYLRYTPPPFIESDGKFYANLQGGYMMTRRIPK